MLYVIQQIDRFHGPEMFYIVGLSHRVVNDNGTLQMLIDRGNGNR